MKCPSLGQSIEVGTSLGESELKVTLYPRANIRSTFKGHPSQSKPQPCSSQFSLWMVHFCFWLEPGCGSHVPQNSIFIYFECLSLTPKKNCTTQLHCKYTSHVHKISGQRVTRMERGREGGKEGGREGGQNWHKSGKKYFYLDEVDGNGRVMASKRHWH